MQAAELIEPKTCEGTWRTIPRSDTEGLTRYVEIIRKMDQRYEVLSLAYLRTLLRRHRGELQQCRGPDFEIMMGFFHSNRAQCYYLWNVGIDGNIGVPQAIELCVDRFQYFLAERSQTFVIAIRPWTMTFKPMEEYLNLVPENPRLRVSVVEKAADSAFWRIELAVAPEPVSDR